MQQRAGLLFLSKNTERILLILDNNQKWSVPTFIRNNSMLDDAEELLIKYSRGKILPIDLYISADKGFEYSTYICLVDQEFNTLSADTICWSSVNFLPKNLHNGLKITLSNQLTQTKIKTVIDLFRQQ